MWDQILVVDKKLGLPKMPYPLRTARQITVTDAGRIKSHTIELSSKKHALWTARGEIFVLDAYPEGETGTDSDFPATPGVYWLYDINNTDWHCMWYWFGGDSAIEVYGASSHPSKESQRIEFEVISMRPLYGASDLGKSIFTRHNTIGKWIRLLDLSKSNPFGLFRHHSFLLNWVMTKDFDKLLL